MTEAVSEIDWTADSADTAIKPGEFDQFNVSTGPLPKVGSLTFKAIQTYSDGTIVNWIEVPAAGSATEPEHPAPTLTLAAATSDATSTASPSAAATATATASSDKASSGAATTGLVLGAIGVVLGIGALLVALRRKSDVSAH